MRRHVLNEHGLTIAEERFVGLIARGYTQRQAAKEAFPSSKLSDSGFDKKASTLRKRPAIEGRLLSLLDAAKIEDLYSAGRWVADVLEDIAIARARNNLTAVASSRRMLGQALGVLKDHVVLSAEQSMSDDDLVKQLAGDDERKAATLRSVMGSGTFSKAA